MPDPITVVAISKVFNIGYSTGLFDVTVNLGACFKVGHDFA